MIEKVILFCISSTSSNFLLQLQKIPKISWCRIFCKARKPRKMLDRCQFRVKITCDSVQVALKHLLGKINKVHLVGTSKFHSGATKLPTRHFYACTLYKQERSKQSPVFDQGGSF